MAHDRLFLQSLTAVYSQPLSIVLACARAMADGLIFDDESDGIMLRILRASSEEETLIETYWTEIQNIYFLRFMCSLSEEIYRGISQNSSTFTRE